MAHDNSTYETALEELGYQYAWEHQEFAENHDFQLLWEYFSQEYYMTDSEDAQHVWRGVARAWAEMKAS